MRLVKLHYPHGVYNAGETVLLGDSEAEGLIADGTGAELAADDPARVQLEAEQARAIGVGETDAEADARRQAEAAKQRADNDELQRKADADADALARQQEADRVESTLAAHAGLPGDDVAQPNRDGDKVTAESESPDDAKQPLSRDSAGKRAGDAGTGKKPLSD